MGRIVHLRTPPPSEHLRVETGVRAGDEISRYYDPMIAKLVVHGQDRDLALHRLREALAGYQVVGVMTNASFLQRLVAHHAFATAKLDTGLIARHRAEVLPNATAPSERALRVAALAALVRQREDAAARAAASSDPWSPWDVIGTGWLNR